MLHSFQHDAILEKDCCTEVCEMERTLNVMRHGIVVTTVAKCTNNVQTRAVHYLQLDNVL